MRGIVPAALLATLASAPASAERCPGDRAATLAVEPGTAYVTLDDGQTRAFALPSGALRWKRAAEPRPALEPALRVTAGARTFVASGDCRESELSVADSDERVVTRGLIVAVAAAGSTVVALRHDGVLLVVPARGKPKPRIARWRQK
jgi:hypothetical protein